VGGLNWEEAGCGAIAMTAKTAEKTITEKVLFNTILNMLR
jgi:hypothetical protein